MRTDQDLDSAALAGPSLEEILREVRRIELWARRRVAGAQAGGYASAFPGSGIEVHEIREYVEGDDPRAVDWNVTARTGRPFVKTFVEERDLTLLLLLDLSLSMRAGRGRFSFRDAAARTIALLALSANRSHDRIGLLAVGREVEAFVPPARGLAHALRIVRDTLVLEPRTAGTDLGAGLDFATRALRRRAVLVLVTDGFAPDPGQALRTAALRHDLLVVHLQEPEPGRGPPMPLRLRDPESGRIHHGLGEAALRDVRATAARRLSEACRAAAVPLIPTPVPPHGSEDALLGPLLAHFAARTRGAR
jgi:uncharacterized protein (DUF58 family)